MKIAFLHSENEFNAEMLRELGSRLTQHELLPWITGKSAPAEDLDVLLSVGCVGRQQVEDQPKLALIQTASTGYENVDIDAATELGIWVSYAPSDLTGNAISVAEFAVLLLLGASRHLGQALQSLHDNAVKPSRLNPALSGKIVCIVGLGSIGQLLVDRLRPFGMQIVATDEHPEHAPADVTAFPADQLEAAVAHADYVVVCVRASKENDNLINVSVLRAMKRGAILINIARGMLIDEGALLGAVKDGQISAAGLDVLRKEPPDPKNPLLDLPQVLVTPHIAGSTDLMLHGTVNYVSQVIEEFAAGKKPKSILNTPQKPRRPLRE
jgi:phosphoglycerate dehydrogenase-like enzyme